MHIRVLHKSWVLSIIVSSLGFEKLLLSCKSLCLSFFIVQCCSSLRTFRGFLLIFRLLFGMPYTGEVTLHTWSWTGFMQVYYINYNIKGGLSGIRKWITLAFLNFFFWLFLSSWKAQSVLSPAGYTQSPLCHIKSFFPCVLFLNSSSLIPFSFLIALCYIFLQHLSKWWNQWRADGRCLWQIFSAS